MFRCVYVPHNAARAYTHDLTYAYVAYINVLCMHSVSHSAVAGEATGSFGAFLNVCKPAHDPSNSTVVNVPFDW